MEYFEDFGAFCKALRTNGAFLVASEGGRTNIMTIGWAQIGIVWGKPVMTVLVRRSRFTHGFMERSEYFTVCVPPEGEMRAELAFCGSKSGRDHDKAAECGLSVKSGPHDDIKYIAGSELVYECRKLENARMLPDTLAQKVKSAYYADGDYHTIYFGEIESVHKG
ncbi:MAG TPA: flavin reductase [Elusimicrobiales bacterium]|nr:flavin reductase [Elusimicrobiales bacterium]